MKVTTEELVEIVKSVKGNTIATMETLTEVRMNKTDNPFYGATKKSWVQVQVGADYENSVNNQLGREDKDLNFVAQKSTATLTDCKNIKTNKDGTSLLLWVKVMGYFKKSVYYFEGKEIAKETIAPYMIVYKPPKTQSLLNKKIDFKTYKFSSIKKIKIFKQKYELTEMPEAKKDAVEEKEVVKA